MTTKRPSKILRNEAWLGPTGVGWSKGSALFSQTLQQKSQGKGPRPEERGNDVFAVCENSPANASTRPHLRCRAHDSFSLIMRNCQSVSLFDGVLGEGFTLTFFWFLCLVPGMKDQKAKIAEFLRTLEDPYAKLSLLSDDSFLVEDNHHVPLQAMPQKSQPKADMESTNGN